MSRDEPKAPDAERPQKDERQDSTQDEARPLLRVIRGDATPEEVAALVAVVAALGSPGDESPRRPTPEWSAHHRKVRTALPHGPGGWRSSGLPR